LRETFVDPSSPGAFGRRRGHRHRNLTPKRGEPDWKEPVSEPWRIDRSEAVKTEYLAEEVSGETADCASAVTASAGLLEARPRGLGKSEGKTYFVANPCAGTEAVIGIALLTSFERANAAEHVCCD
jgi:hypothetical protein